MLSCLFIESGSFHRTCLWGDSLELELAPFQSFQNHQNEIYVQIELTWHNTHSLVYTLPLHDID
jgi:hypothetical protein